MRFGLPPAFSSFPIILFEKLTNLSPFYDPNRLVFPSPHMILLAPLLIFSLYASGLPVDSEISPLRFFFWFLVKL